MSTRNSGRPVWPPPGAWRHVPLRGSLFRGLQALCLAAVLLTSETTATLPPACCSAPSKAGPVWFAAGEKLTFRVDWNPPWYLFFLPPMDAGNVEVNLAGETVFQGKRALKITFTARSSGTLVKMAGFKIDDYYEFLTDPETFCTFSVVRRERQGKRKRDIEILYIPETRQLHIKDVDVATSPPTTKKDLLVDQVPPCVQDALSALYSLRMKELGSGTLIRSLVGNNDRFKEVESRVEKRETLETPSGKYDTWRLQTFSLMGGLFRESGQFKIWLTADSRKMPVQFEARVYLGKVTGKLAKFSTTDGSGVAGVDRKPNSVSPQR